MVLNVILILIGIISLVYGIKTKLKLWLAVGLLLFGLGAVSAYIDIRMMGLEDIANPNARLPFVIDSMMK